MGMQIENGGDGGMRRKLTTEERRKGKRQQNTPCRAGGSGQGQAHPEKMAGEVG